MCVRRIGRLMVPRVKDNSSWHAKNRYTGRFVRAAGETSKFHKRSPFINNRAEILPVPRKTLYYQSINLGATSFLNLEICLRSILYIFDISLRFEQV